MEMDESRDNGRRNAADKKKPKENLKYITNKRIQRNRNRISCSGNIRIQDFQAHTSCRANKNRLFETRQNKTASSAYLKRKEQWTGTVREDGSHFNRINFTANIFEIVLDIE
ncbi:hypothetical protein NPIL_648531 [Nephila pilipes]|uniref:Uncharacterized protein n=1 Tax=Nephila pilipes TaxID=299642 RepID=A0A8X6MRZ6_NEPPI|nr:hypothetical protein NPIL_648531 [Nephila pilipes]